MIQFSIVIPCYNEAENIPLILERFQKVMIKKVEVILVNNGSTDHTKEVLRKLLPSYSFARTIEIKDNQGYGYGILKGLENAKGQYIGWTHADMQTDPYDVIKAFQMIKSQKISTEVMVKGTRKGRPLSDCIFTTGMSLFETLYLKKGLWDINAQPNIFPKSFFDKWEKPPFDFSLDLYVLYLARVNHLKMIRFDVRFPKRIHGSSHWNTGINAKLKFIKRTLDFSKRLKKEGIH